MKNANASANEVVVANETSNTALTEQTTPVTAQEVAIEQTPAQEEVKNEQEAAHEVAIEHEPKEVGLLATNHKQEYRPGMYKTTFRTALKAKVSEIFGVNVNRISPQQMQVALITTEQRLREVWGDKLTEQQYSAEFEFAFRVEKELVACLTPTGQFVPPAIEVPAAAPVAEKGKGKGKGKGKEKPAPVPAAPAASGDAAPSGETTPPAETGSTNAPKADDVDQVSVEGDLTAAFAKAKTEEEFKAVFEALAAGGYKVVSVQKGFAITHTGFGPAKSDATRTSVKYSYLDEAGKKKDWGTFMDCFQRFFKVVAPVGVATPTEEASNEPAAESTVTPEAAEVKTPEAETSETVA